VTWTLSPTQGPISPHPHKNVWSPNWSPYWHLSMSYTGGTDAPTAHRPTWVGLSTSRRPVELPPKCSGMLDFPKIIGKPHVGLFEQNSPTIYDSHEENQVKDMHQISKENKRGGDNKVSTSRQTCGYPSLSHLISLH
jgi:hypothetical protein